MSTLTQTMIDNAVSDMSGIEKFVNDAAGSSPFTTRLGRQAKNMAALEGEVIDLATGSARYNYDGSTTMADPSTGGIRFNNASLASVTAIAVSALSAGAGNPDISAFIAAFGSANNAAGRGTLVIRDVDATAIFAVFNITGPVTDNGAWLTFPVAYVAGNGGPSSAEVLSLQWSRSGADGADGVSGTSALSRVRVVATANVAIATALEAGDVIDDVTLAANDLVLLSAQSDPEENGVYVVSASGAAARHSDFSAYDALPGTYFSVMEGTAKADTLWRCTSNRGGTIGTTAVAISEFAAGGGVVPLVLTNDSLDTIQLLDAASSHILALGASTSVNLNGYGSGAGAQIKFTPESTGAHNAFDIRAVDSRLQLTAEGGAANPRIVLSDTNVLGSVVPGGGNIAGISLEATARAGGAGPAYFNFINRGATGASGAEQSATLNIWGTSTLGDTQHAIMFFNGTGTNLTSGTLTATPAGARLGEIAGFPSLPDGHFTQTETVSIDFYNELTTTGTTNDGSYKAPSNIVFRTAPNSTNPQRNAMVLDYNANLLVGTGWANYNNGIAGAGSALYVRGAPANVGAVNLKFDKSAEQGISIQNSAGDTGTGNIVLIHNTAGTVIGSISGNASSVAFNTSSDRRLKTNIQSANDVGEIIDALEVVSFEFLNDRGKTYIGFIAQDEYSVFPDAVSPGDDHATSPDDDGFRAWARDDSKLVPLLVSAVQELRRRTASLA